MSNVSLVIASPKRTLRLVLGSGPIKTPPVQLQAFLFDGEDDVSSEAAISWHVSWKGSYRTYSAKLSTGASVVTELTTGGDRLTAVAVYRGARHRASVRLVVHGTNPNREQVSQALDGDDVLKAICWQESTWRQFSESGALLKNKGSTARGISQIMEYFWAGSKDIAHNDYVRIAWQWDYALQAARDILALYRKRVLKKFPAIGEQRVLDWTIAIYHDGPKRLGTSKDPSTDDCVVDIRNLMAERPWEE